MILPYSYQLPVTKICHQCISTGLNSDFVTVSLSSSAMNKMLYGGAILVPITVPRFYLSIFFRM